MRVDEYLKTVRMAPCMAYPNYIKMPITRLDPTEENAELFTGLVKKFKSFGELTFTKSGGISKQSYKTAHHSICIGDWAGVKVRDWFVELVVVWTQHGMFRVMFGATVDTNKGGAGITGREAFKAFIKELRKDGIDLNSYADEFGFKFKEKIEKPMICLEKESYKNETIENAHHIDFHNSYPAGLCNTHPEFRPTVERLYKDRKDKPMNKAVLNLSIGYMQSRIIGYKFARLSMDAINDNNKRLKGLAKELKSKGRKIIAYNTDGFWYTGEVYHGKGEGDNLGQWHNDHTNCKIRFKSAGAYEYIENGKYTPVVRGRTTLDKIKDRSDWQWGDIYEGTGIKFIWDPQERKLKVEDEE